MMLRINNRYDEVSITSDGVDKPSDCISTLHGKCEWSPGKCCDRVDRVGVVCGVDYDAM